MEIRDSRQGDCLIAAISGELSVATASELDAWLAGALGDASRLEFDFAHLDFISSAGMRSMLAAHKTMTARGGSMTIKNCSPAVMEVFEIVGFDTILDFE